MADVRSYAYLSGSVVSRVLLFPAGKQEAGGIEVTAQTGIAGVGYQWDGTLFIPPTLATRTISPIHVKAEAHRRIVAIIPEWKQRNMIAQAAILSEKGRANWTAQEQTDWDAGVAIWGQVAAIRAASDAIEAMAPIPLDYRDDSYWP